MTVLMDALFRAIPAGVGRGGPYRFAQKELRRLMGEGVGYLKVAVWRPTAISSTRKPAAASGAPSPTT